jgi:hypothetical protein
MSVPYKRFSIDPKVYERSDTIGFSVSEVFVFDPRQESDFRYFTEPRVFQTAEEAIQVGIWVGRRAADLYLQ